VEELDLQINHEEVERERKFVEGLEKGSMIELSEIELFQVKKESEKKNIIVSVSFISSLMIFDS
jgi:hypothetical protein